MYFQLLYLRIILQHYQVHVFANAFYVSSFSVLPQIMLCIFKLRAMLIVGNEKIVIVEQW